MTYEHIQVAKMTAPLGAEISGVDLSKPLEEPVRDEIARAMLDHLVVFFRGQDITVDDHFRFACGFGDLYTHPIFQPLKDQGRPEIFELQSDAKRPFVAALWHTDITFEPDPPKASVLRAIEVPEAGGDTMWASMEAAYDGLSDTMQHLLSGLSAIHQPSYFYQLANDEQRKRFDDRGDVIHPVVRTHPVSGRKAIFVNGAFTSQIVGMKEKESEKVLAFLYEHIDSSEFHCRFHWTKNAIAMWDNQNTQHRVVADDPTARRVMQRLTLAGDKPF
ncbi:MAG: taurine dioxygenase [bacterium]|nr:taurine dioxygenase [Deltaproteobacteria bacterium]MCP4907996.1 taurine dioxygenase [bacterium]